MRRSRDDAAGAPLVYAGAVVRQELHDPIRAGEGGHVHGRLPILVRGIDVGAKLHGHLDRFERCLRRNLVDASSRTVHLGAAARETA